MQQSNPVRINNINTLIGNQFCPDNVRKIAEYKSMLEASYLSRENFRDLKENVDKYNHTKTLISETKSNKNQFETKKSKLSTASAAKLRQEALVYSIPTDGLKDDDLRSVLLAKLDTKLKELFDLERELEKQEKALHADEELFRKSFSEYTKKAKAEYRAWKLANTPNRKSQITDLKAKRSKTEKSSPEYFSLTNEITAAEDCTSELLDILAKSSLDDFAKDTYRLRLERDQLNTNTTRLSNSGRKLGAYVKDMVNAMVTGLVATNNARYKLLIANTDNVAGVKPVVELSDFVVSQFSPSPAKSICELLVDTSDLTPIPAGDIAAEILKDIENYVKRFKIEGKKIPAFNKNVCLVMTHTIVKFVQRVCELVKTEFIKTGINTVQAKIIESILNPFYLFSGQAHPVLPKKVKKVK